MEEAEEPIAALGPGPQWPGMTLGGHSWNESCLSHLKIHSALYPVDDIGCHGNDGHGDAEHDDPLVDQESHR